MNKHGIRFSDAVAVFEDEMALNREDTDALGEQRFVATGIDFIGRILTIAYTYRPRAICLISARQATNTEKNTYEQYQFLNER